MAGFVSVTTSWWIDSCEGTGFRPITAKPATFFWHSRTGKKHKEKPGNFPGFFVVYGLLQGTLIRKLVKKLSFFIARSASSFV